MNKPSKLLWLMPLSIPFLALLAVMGASATSVEVEKPPPGCGVKLTYSRQPRHTAPIGPIGDASNWQHVQDIGRILQFSEADLMLGPKVIHNCTTSPEICAAINPRVSPDAKKIAYSLHKGRVFLPVKAWGGPMTDLMDFATGTSEIWVYDIAADKSQRISSGYIDTTPEWVDNETLVFATSRGGVFPNWGYNGNYYPHKGLQIWRGKIDGVLTHLENLTPHEQLAFSPAVLTTGEICYASWQGFGERGRDHTPRNQWWALCMDGNGANTRSILGAHGSPHVKTTAYLNDWLTSNPTKRGEGVTEIRGLRTLAEIAPGYLAISNYYRSNSTGAMGAIFGWEHHSTAEGVSKLINFKEGTAADTRVGSGRFIPPSFKSLTPYGTDQDSSFPRFHKDGRAAGRTGYPAPHPSGWLFTHARGWCYEALPIEMANRKAMGGEPPCKKEIRLSLVDVVKNPFDEAQSVCVAGCQDKWQAWDGRAVVPYQKLYGQAVPKAIPAIKGDKAFLQVVDARAAELEPFPNAKPQDRISFQGNAVDDYSARVAGFRIELVSLWQSKPTTGGYSERMHYKTTPLESDGSVRVEVPCDAPFLMSGVDADGNVIAVDNMPHSLRCGEVRTCHGCHDGHSVERTNALGESPEARFARTMAAKP